MKRSYSARVKSFLILRRKRKRLAVEVAEAACLLEKSLAKVHLNGEPELPNQYRHIRSAIGALLILGRSGGLAGKDSEAIAGSLRADGNEVRAVDNTCGLWLTGSQVSFAGVDL